MKFFIEQEVLNQTLSEAQRFVSGKALSPSLGGIFFQVNEDGKSVIIRAANAQGQYLSTLPTDGSDKNQAGTVVLPAGVVGSAIKAFDKGPVSFELEGETVLARQKTVRFTISPLPAEDFPAPPNLEAGQEIVLPRAAFLEVSETVSVAASRDETKPVLTSLLLEMSAPNALVTSDGFRLYRHEVELSLDTPKTLLLPSRTLKEVLGIMKRLDSAVVQARWDESTGQLIFILGETVVQVSLVSGDFPPYRAIIPEACSFAVTLDRELLLQRIQQVMVMARELSSIVVFQSVVGNDGVEFEVASQAGIRGASTASLPTLQVDGEIPRFACNGTYVLDFLTTIDSTDVTIQGTDPLKPIVLTVPGKKEILYLIMPFKLQS